MNSYFCEGFFHHCSHGRVQVLPLLHRQEMSIQDLESENEILVVKYNNKKKTIIRVPLKKVSLYNLILIVYLRLKCIIDV
jgi:hypothetical protein